MKSTWNIELTFRTLPTYISTNIMLNFHAIWRWSLGWLWPVLDGMTQ